MGENIERKHSQVLAVYSPTDIINITKEQMKAASALETDKNIGTPSLLGLYFKDMVERIAGEKAHSKAALVEQVKKQFTTQIETQGKQITELQKQMAEQNMSFRDSMDKYAKEVADAKLANKDLQEQMKFAAIRAKNKRKGLVKAVVWLSVLLAAAVVICVLLLNR